MNINFLLDILKYNPGFMQVYKSVTGGKRATQVEGLASAAKSLFLTAIESALHTPMLVVTYNYEQAERMHEDITSAGFNPDSIFLVPPADSMIYNESDTDLDVISKRLQALAYLQSGKVGIVIAPIAAVLQRTIAPDVLSGHLIKIDKSSPLDLDECSLNLVKLGYEHVLMIEKQGEFSRRGGILDIFSSTEESPVRIEMFGDEIESIRSFDVESQRSSDAMNSVVIAPARELILDKESSDSAVDAISGILEAECTRLDAEVGNGVAQRLRAKVEADVLKICDGSYFDGIEYYFPVIHQKEFCLLDYLPVGTMVVLDEPHQIQSHWDQLHVELLESLNARINRGDVLALPSDHVVSFDEFASRLRHGYCNLLLSMLPRAVTWADVDEHVSMPAAPMDTFSAQIGVLIEQLKTWLANDCRTVLVSNKPQRIVELLSEHGISVSPIPDDAGRMPAGIYVINGSLRAGFKFGDARLMVVTDSEMFGAGRVRHTRKAFKKGLALTSLLELSPGDYVVHINHGIGRYAGMSKLSGTSGDRDYLLLEYTGGDKLYVPVDQIDRVQKYIGSEGHAPAINKLGGTDWAKTTKKVKQSVREMAKELIALYAARQSLEGYSYPPDTPWQQEMESSFPYTETPDQLDAIHDVKQDLESPKPMDRLICGDVGYGKTEVAIRAVFKVINDGKQVAVLAPTTVLTQQHYNTFVERLAAYPVKVAMLSRFRSKSEQRQTVEQIRTGEVDVVIGTHRLLSKDIDFRDLGLLVIDEEQRFGVAHKERLKQLRKTVDVLTLTATPIPRTLHMSLSGIRDMSLINDPPEGRTPVKTHCTEYEDELVRDAILRELDRDGQVYFVHNRVDNIEHIADHIRNLVPYAKVDVGHGQMGEHELERVMIDFYENKFDVLVCTTIIESGLDIPNVNTIIINNADKMGLAQLYQLRGRVGRSNRQAYSYLLYEPFRVMSEVAEKRLQAIREFSDLGSGFKIALRDLEIRGAGNLLGAEQHGQMSSVGFDMYCRLLAEAVNELKGEEPSQFELPPADLPMDAYIPKEYIPSESLRMSFYKKMTAVREPGDIDQIADEFKDRFGELPKPVKNSLEILRIRMKAVLAQLEAISSDNRQVSMRFGTGIRLAPDVAKGLKRKYQGCVFMGDKVLIDSGSPRLLKLIGYILDDLPAALDESRDLYLAKIY
ncbi:MAG: transcription-repair coupling factor [Armatimonadota bacterium]